MRSLSHFLFTQLINVRLELYQTQPSVILGIELVSCIIVLYTNARRKKFYWRKLTLETLFLRNNYCSCKPNQILDGDARQCFVILHRYRYNTPIIKYGVFFLIVDNNVPFGSNTIFVCNLFRCKRDVRAWFVGRVSTFLVAFRVSIVSSVCITK